MPRDYSKSKVFKLSCKDDDRIFLYFSVVKYLSQTKRNYSKYAKQDKKGEPYQWIRDCGFDKLDIDLVEQVDVRNIDELRKRWKEIRDEYIKDGIKLIEK